MAIKHRSTRKTRAKAFRRDFSSSIAERLARKKPSQFRKLTPSELESVGKSRTSERYVERSVKRLTDRTPTISKRQFEQLKVGVTLEERAAQFRSGERTPKTAREARLRDISLSVAELRRKYKGEKISRIREHLRNMASKENGEFLDKETWLREKAFTEDHLDLPEEQDWYVRFFNYGKRSKRAMALAA